VHRVRALALLGSVLAIGWTSSARAAPFAIAPVASDGPISAYGGWVVWSTPVEGGWGLTAWHDGKVLPVRVVPRAQPFDLDLGPDAKGRVVATFSRCSNTPRVSFAMTQPWTGDDCGGSILDLLTGDERRLDVERPEGASDTSLSMWGDRIAFARTDLEHGQVQQLLLYNERTGLTRTLRTGTTRGVSRGAIQSLDLGSRVAAFLWWVEGSRVAGHGGWEVRADRLATGASLRVGTGLRGEACTGTADLVAPAAPFVDGYEVWYSSLTSNCYADTVSLVHYRTRRRGGVIGGLTGEVLQVVKTSGQLFALVAPKVANDRTSCTGPAGPCTLMRIDAPARFGRLPRVGSPFV
jgi:hypothetical protein